MIGAWIDSLNDQQRDRIIQHPDPTYDGERWWDGDRECGCLVGCVVKAEPGASYGNPMFLPTGNALSRSEAGRVGCFFPVLTDRFTPERMWRVVKARAAKRNRVNVEGEASLVSAVASDTKIV